MRPDHPTMLPSLFLTGPAADAGYLARTTRDWIVDITCFLLAVDTGVAVYAVLAFQGLLPPDSLLIADIAVSALSCIALWCAGAGQ